MFLKSILFIPVHFLMHLSYVWIVVLLLKMWLTEFIINYKNIKCFMSVFSNLLACSKPAGWAHAQSF